MAKESAPYLYTYVPKRNTLDVDGLYGPSGDTYKHLLKRYGMRANVRSKKGILEWLERADPGRSRSISVLTEPIPENVNKCFEDFRKKRMLVRLPSAKALVDAGVIEPVMLRNRPWEIEMEKHRDIVPDKIDWSQVNEKQVRFKGIPHWFLITKDGHIPPKYLEKMGSMSLEERKLRRIAKPYYVPTGKNSWEHVQQVMATADAMTRSVYGRPLTLEEKAAILFHDSAVKPYGTHTNHGQNGKNMVMPLLAATGFFNKKQVKDIGQAILEHETLDYTGGPFSSTIGEVLASGDANPPELPWVLNKMYSWHIQHTPGRENWKQGIYDSAQEYYGHNVKAKQPPLYNAFHKQRVPEMKQRIANATPDELWDIVTKYRKKHRIGDYDIKFPAPTLLKAAYLAAH